MTKLSHSGEVEVKGKFTGCEWLKGHVFALDLFAVFHWHGSSWDLVKQIELFNFGRHVCNNNLAFVRGFGEKFFQRIFLLLAVFMVTVNYHHIWLQSYRAFPDLTSEKHQVGLCLDTNTDVPFGNIFVRCFRSVLQEV